MLFEKIERELEKKAMEKGLVLGEENVTIKLEMNVKDRTEWENETCNKIMELGYWYEWEENYYTGEYDLIITA